MAFILKQATSYTWPIKLVLPTDGGRKETHTFDGEFRRLPQSRITEVIQISQSLQRGESANNYIADEELAAEVLIGWKGIVDDDGNDVVFSDAALNQLLEIPGIPGQIIKQFFESINSEKKPGKRGN